MKKNLIFLALLLLATIIFLPKKNIYYSAEKALSATHLYLNNEQIRDHIFYLHVSDASLLLDSLPVGTIEEITFIPAVFYNRITLHSLNFNKEFHSLFPEGIESLSFTYTLLHPLTITIEGKAGFGPIDGSIHLEKKELILSVQASQNLRDYPLLLAKLHKSEKGLVYETSF